MKTKAKRANGSKRRKRPCQGPYVRPQYRDTMFSAFFRNPGNFTYLLKRCRAAAAGTQGLGLSASGGLTAEDIEAFGLGSDTVYRARKNDVAFLTRDGRLIILAEHQTVLTRNLALKIFLYYVELIQLWLEKNNINIHTERGEITVPLPELYVAYNGPGEIGEYTRRFSVNHQGVRIDAEVSITDIRYGSLDDLDASDALAGYSYFQKRKDELELQGMTRDRAFMEARRECIEKGYMKGFIEKEEFLVYKRIFDYDEQLRSEGEAIGEARGEAIGEARGVAMQAEKMLRSAIKNNRSLHVLEVMADDSGISRERLQQLIEEAPGRVIA